MLLFALLQLLFAFRCVLLLVPACFQMLLNAAVVVDCSMAVIVVILVRVCVVSLSMLLWFS